MNHFYRWAIPATFILLIASSAHAQAERLGDPGQIAISSDAALSIRETNLSGGPDALTIELAPAADFFVVHGLSVGGSISLSYAKSGDSHATRFGIGPRVGYNISFTNLLSLWPRIGLSYSHTSITGAIAIADTTVERTTSGNALALNLFAPLMVVPAEHFFAGFGPFLDVDMTGSHKATSFGAKLTLGGWMD
jgi:hypothetical protein